MIVSVGGVDVGTGDDALGTVVRSHQPGDVGRRSCTGATASEHATTVDARREHQRPTAPTPGAAILGVSSGGATEWQAMSIGEAAVSSVTDLFPAAWESVKGVVTVLNPVNIVEHLTGPTDDLRDPADHARRRHPGVAARSAPTQGLAGVLYMLAALNVFVGVFNMFPLLPLDGGHAAIAVYERIRERAIGGRRYFTDVARLMPFAMGVIARPAVPVHVRPLPRHHRSALTASPRVRGRLPGRPVATSSVQELGWG